MLCTGSHLGPTFEHQCVMAALSQTVSLRNPKVPQNDDQSLKGKKGGEAVKPWFRHLYGNAWIQSWPVRFTSSFLLMHTLGGTWGPATPIGDSPLNSGTSGMSSFGLA